MSTTELGRSNRQKLALIYLYFKIYQAGPNNQDGAKVSRVPPIELDTI